MLEMTVKKLSDTTCGKTYYTQIDHILDYCNQQQKKLRLY